MHFACTKWTTLKGTRGNEGGEGGEVQTGAHQIE